jgi:hypothetical protein
MDRYEDFQRVTTASLEWAIDHLGLDADDTAKRLLVAEYRKLEPFPRGARGARSHGARPAARHPLQWPSGNARRVARAQQAAPLLPRRQS